MYFAVVTRLIVKIYTKSVGDNGRNTRKIFKKKISNIKMSIYAYGFVSKEKRGKVSLFRNHNDLALQLFYLPV